MMNRHWVAVRCEASRASKATPAVAEASEATNNSSNPCTPPQSLYNSKTIQAYTINSMCIQLLPTQASKH